MSFALSCSWNSFRHTNAEDLVDEIRQLGFDSIELNFGLTPEIVRGIGRLVDSKVIKVISVHNFCPVPEGIEVKAALPDCYSMASQDESVRKKAVKYSKVTIDTAARLNASAVILHCGRVEGENKTRKLKELYKCNLKDSLRYEELKKEIIEERKRKGTPYFEAALKSIQEISGYAKEKGVKIGIENRVYYHEIPSFEEMAMVLSQTDPEQVFYWHDTGHAQFLENLSLAVHQDYLKRYGGRLLGVHLHNVEGADDHKAVTISRGSVDFSLLKPYLKEDTLKVIEVHYPAAAEQIIESRKFLEHMYG